MKKLKILHVSDAYYPFPGGVSEHMYHLSKALRERGHEVYILTANYNGQEDEKYVKRVGKIHTFLANKTQITWTFSWNLPFEVKKFIRENKFDVIHTHGPLAPNLPFLALHFSNSINVATFHTAFVGFNFYKIAKYFFKNAFKKIDCAICVSNKAFEEIYPYFPYKEKYRIIPNGIDTQRFKPEGEKIEKFLKHNFKILYVGRLEPRKGFPVLLKAFELIADKVDGILIVAGKGIEEENYKKMVPERLKPKVFFEGFVPFEKLPAYYRTCDLYVSPALGGETFGIVLLEAMASGACVIASNIDGYNEVLKDGKNGILFEKGNYKELSEKILTLYKNKDLRKKLADSGYRFSENFDWKKITEKAEEVYLKMVKIKISEKY